MSPLFFVREKTRSSAQKKKAGTERGSRTVINI
jgi:hypothetical protein